MLDLYPYLAVPIITRCSLVVYWKKYILLGFNLGHNYYHTKIECLKRKIIVKVDHWKQHVDVTIKLVCSFVFGEY